MHSQSSVDVGVDAPTFCSLTSFALKRSALDLAEAHLSTTEACLSNKRSLTNRQRVYIGKRSAATKIRVMPNPEVMTSFNISLEISQLSGDTRTKAHLNIRTAANPDSRATKRRNKPAVVRF